MECNHWLISQTKKKVSVRDMGHWKNVHLQSMLAARCRLNQRSCTWIIATREPVPVSHLHILSYRSQSQSDAIQQIAVCVMLSAAKLETSKTFLLKSSFHAAWRFAVWCWFCLMGTGVKFHITQLQWRRPCLKQVCKIEALCIFISKWDKCRCAGRMEDGRRLVLQLMSDPVWL